MGVELQDFATVRRLAIGGFVNHRKPIGLMHAMAGKLQNLEELVLFSASVDLDLALAQWPSIRTVHCPFGGIEGVTAISPLYRVVLEAREVTAPAWDTGLLAIAIGADAPVRSNVGLGTDLPRLNPWLRIEGDAVVVSPLSIDLALIHAPHGDGEGEVWWLDSPWGDALLVDRAGRTLASCGEVRSTSTEVVARANVGGVTKDEGTWPTADPPHTATNEASLRDYVAWMREGPSRERVLEWWARNDPA